MTLVAGLVKVDPPPVQVLPLRYNPQQYLRQRGTAIWEERTVERGKSVTEYRGVSAHRITLDLFFDSIRRPVPAPAAAVPYQQRPTVGDIEETLNDLHRLALPWVQGDPHSEPPKVQLRYGHGQQLVYVIADLFWNRVLVNHLGRRVQADVTVELLEYRAPTLALTPASPVETVTAGLPYQGRPTSGAGAVAPPRTYTVRSGDTLSAIAARELGSPGRFVEIFSLNSPPLTSPDLIQVGQVLTLPAA